MESSDVVSLLGDDVASLAELGRWVLMLTVLLGAEVLGELDRFSKEAGPGAMITIRRTRDAFTAQVTGAIVSGTGATFTPDMLASVAGGGDSNLLRPTRNGRSDD